MSINAQDVGNHADQQNEIEKLLGVKKEDVRIPGQTSGMKEPQLQLIQHDLEFSLEKTKWGEFNFKLGKGAFWGIAMVAAVLTGANYSVFAKTFQLFNSLFESLPK